MRCAPVHVEYIIAKAETDQNIRRIGAPSHSFKTVTTFLLHLANVPSPAKARSTWSCGRDRPCIQWWTRILMSKSLRDAADIPCVSLLFVLLLVFYSGLLTTLILLGFFWSISMDSLFLTYSLLNDIQQNAFQIRFDGKYWQTPFTWYSRLWSYSSFSKQQTWCCILFPPWVLDGPLTGSCHW